MKIEEAIDRVESSTKAVLAAESGLRFDRNKKVSAYGYSAGDDFRGFAQRILDHAGKAISVTMPVFPVSFPSAKLLKGTLQMLMDAIVDVVVKTTKSRSATRSKSAPRAKSAIRSKNAAKSKGAAKSKSKSKSKSKHKK